MYYSLTPNFMEQKMMKRIVWGKSLGFGVGLLGVLIIPLFIPDVTLMMKVGFVLWYTMVGALVALAGVLTRHPWFGFPFPASMRGALLGGAMNLALVLIAYPTLEALMNSATLMTGLSPFWLVLEGMIVGLIIDLVATKKTGEGNDLM